MGFGKTFGKILQARTSRLRTYRRWCFPFQLWIWMFIQRDQGRKSSGTHQHMYLERLRSDITAATYVSALPRMTGSFMRCPFQIGLPPLASLPQKNLRFPRPVTSSDYPALEKISESAVKDKQKFERLVVSKEKLLEMFNVRFLLPFRPVLKSSIVQQIQAISHPNESSRW